MKKIHLTKRQLALISIVALSCNLTATSIVVDTLPHGQSQVSQPAYLSSYVDPAFNLSITRITDSSIYKGQEGVPTYSELQAWNADQTLMLLANGEIINASTFKREHRIDYGWPAFGSAPRWSPVDPLVLYYTGGLGSGGNDPDGIACAKGSARLMRYRLTRGTTISGSRELVRCFSEYTEFSKDASWQELSNDGRYIALVGKRPDGVYEVFSYDLQTNTKSPVLVCPDAIYQGQTIHRSPDWAGISPSGAYVLVMWSSGTERYRGLEAYTRSTMAYAGKVTCGSGHGDVIMDGQGTEWYVYTNANNSYFLSGKHYIVKSRIPNGVVYNNNFVDAQATVSSGASVPLLSLDWYLGVHVSCRSIHSKKKGAFVSIDGKGSANGIPAYSGEIFYVDLSSTSQAPKIERLAHHRSDPEYIASLSENVCPLSSYWAQPHATVSPDGTQIVFGSSWGTHCRAEAYVIDIKSTLSSIKNKNTYLTNTNNYKGIIAAYDLQGRRWSNIKENKVGLIINVMPGKSPQIWYRNNQSQTR